MTIVADVAERARLAERFDLLDLGELAATVTLIARAGAIDAEGRLNASVAQRCVTTGAPVVARIDHAFSLRFVDPAYLMSVAEETELSAADCDIVAHDGTTLDLGEAVAQTLALALDQPLQPMP